MDTDGLPLVGSGIDYTTVESIEKRRLLAFVNHYVTHTVRFLNRFSRVCEDKLAEVHTRIQRVDVALSILEAKIASIPGLEDIKPQSNPAASTAAPTAASSGPAPAPASAQPAESGPPPPSGAPADQGAAAPPPPPPQEVNVPKVSQDPRYVKYFKMMSMGVPAQAVKMKMQADGQDPSLLDSPDAPAPPDDSKDADSSDNESSGSADSFQSD